MSFYALDNMLPHEWQPGASASGFFLCHAAQVFVQRFFGHFFYALPYTESFDAHGL
jgi:hypothetical protein